MMGVSRPARSTASHHQRSRPRSVPRPQTSPSDEEQLRNPNRRFLQPLHRLTGPRSPVLLHARQRGRKKSEPVRFKTKENRHPNCEIHRHRKTNPSLGALPQPQWLARGSGCVAVVLKQLTPTFHRRVTRAAEFLEAAATESPPELPQREEHLLVYQILLDPSRRADSGEERSHRAPTETPENRVSLSPLETRFEIREKTKWAREAQLPLRGRKNYNYNCAYSTMVFSWLCVSHCFSSFNELDSTYQ